MLIVVFHIHTNSKEISICDLIKNPPTNEQTFSREILSNCSEL